MYDRDLFDDDIKKEPSSTPVSGFAALDDKLSEVKISALPKELSEQIVHVVNAHNLAYADALNVAASVNDFASKYTLDDEQKNNFGWYRYSNPSEWVTLKLEESRFIGNSFDTIGSYIKKNYGVDVSGSDLEEYYLTHLFGEKYSHKDITMPLNSEIIHKTIEESVLCGRNFSDIAEKEMEARVKKIFSLDTSDCYRMQNLSNWFNLSGKIIGIERAIHYNVSYNDRIYSSNMSEFCICLTSALSKMKTGKYIYEDLDIIYPKNLPNNVDDDSGQIRRYISGVEPEHRSMILSLFQTPGNGIITQFQTYKNGTTKLTFVNEEKAREFWTTICDFPLSQDGNKQ